MSATSAAAGPSSQQGASARPAAVNLQWKPCGPEHPGYDCATVTVPLDYDRPSGGTTQLALARFPATDTRHRIGSVFVNPGGPGGSGVGMVLGGFGEFLGTQLDGRFDVVGFDPRGVASSDPLHCFASADEFNEYFAGQPLFPYRNDQFRSYFDTYAGLGRECLDDRQKVAAHMNTADVARDLDLLRRAVGDRRLTYLGFSYGSYLGNTYANLFPNNVRALVIDGVLDPRLWASGWQIKSDRVATQAEFNEFLRLCDAARTECAFWTPAGSAKRWEQLARSIQRDPLELPDGTQYTYDFLIGDATGAMYSPEVWGGPEGAAAFFDLLADAALAGQPTAAAARVRTALMDQLTPDREEADYPNGLDAYYGNQCADTQYPHSFASWLAIDKYARAGSRFGPLWWWGNTGCARWPVNADRYVGPWTARTSSPVLVVGNFFDGVTDYAGAVASDRLLRNSRLLSYAGWGHTAYGRSQCVTDYVDAYLLTQSLPPNGKVCPANPNPFLTATARNLQRTAPLVGLPPPFLTRR
ncbi:alpha/beta hydrolase [Kribbella sp. NPDC049174]|uniref:alpha/beta hydrolase n=1 Tax=Kribbella sp. NPDC049174 TaxID=3364112 RepID=UPI00371D84A3